MFIKSELYKILNSKKSIFFIIWMMLIPLFDLLYIYKAYEIYAGRNPALTGFLATGSFQSRGLLILFMPIYLMLIYSDTYISEVRYGYNNIVFTKLSRKTIIKQRFIVSFALPFIISLVSLVLNFVIVHIIFRGGTGMDCLYFECNSDYFLSLCYSNPNITYILYMIVYCLISGGCGIICTGISFITANYKIAYPVVFFIWIIQIISPYSIAFAMLPFSECGLDDIIPPLVIFVIIVAAVATVSYTVKVKYDEI